MRTGTAAPAASDGAAGPGGTGSDAAGHVPAAGEREAPAGEEPGAGDGSATRDGAAPRPTPPATSGGSGDEPGIPQASPPSVAGDAGLPDLAPDPAAPIRVPTGRLAGRAWDDRDRDGMQDPGEPGLPGVRVWTFSYAFAEPMSPAAMRAAAVASLREWERGRMPAFELAATDSTTTGPDGRYAFPATEAGPVVVAVVTARYQPDTDALVRTAALTAADAADDARDSDFTPIPDGTLGLTTLHLRDGERRTADIGLQGGGPDSLALTGSAVADWTVAGAALCGGGAVLLRFAVSRRNRSAEGAPD